MAKSGIDARRQAALREGAAPYLARRQEIVRTAATIFRERGYESATLLDVAKALGTDRASLYYYYASKEELLQEIILDALKNVLDVALKISRSRRSSREKITALIESMVHNYADSYPHMSIYTEDLGRVARQDSAWAVDVIERTHRYENVVRDVLTKGQRDGTLRNDIPAELADLALFGMINWMHRWYHPDVTYTPAQIAETFTRVFLDGYGTASSRRKAKPRPSS